MLNLKYISDIFLSVVTARQMEGVTTITSPLCPMGGGRARGFNTTAAGGIPKWSSSHFSCERPVAPPPTNVYPHLAGGAGVFSTLVNRRCVGVTSAMEPPHSGRRSAELRWWRWTKRGQENAIEPKAHGWSCVLTELYSSIWLEVKLPRDNNWQKLNDTNLKMQPLSQASLWGEESACITANK